MKEQRQSQSMNSPCEIKQHHYLLIISCSKRKRGGTMNPALQIYDGPVYRALRKRIGYLGPGKVRVFIISAKYGLIPAERVIENYDEKITLERAMELNANVLESLRDILTIGNCKGVFVNLGSKYCAAIRGIEQILPPGLSIGYACGGIGKRTSQTIQWLENVISSTSVLQKEYKIHFI